MAKAMAKKTTTRKRRERKNIERGAAHIRSSMSIAAISIASVSAMV